MATTTQHAPGTFCWVELASTDQPAAKAFYGKLFGWEATDQDLGGGESYTIFKLTGRDVAALYTMGKEERAGGAPPHWNSYVAVESVDQAAAKAKGLGGTVIAEPFDVMDVGRMAIVQDPTGATFCLWQPRKHPGVGARDEAGALCWNELLSSDAGKARSFYTGLFGWKTESMPMSSGGDYTLYKSGDVLAAGMAQITKEMGPIPSNWLVYFAVSDCDATVARAGSLGGKTLMPPTDIPNIGRFAILQDAGGATFAVIRMEGIA